MSAGPPPRFHPSPVPHAKTCIQFRGSIVVSISACHAEDPGSIPGRGVFASLSMRFSLAPCPCEASSTNIPSREGRRPPRTLLFHACHGRTQGHRQTRASSWECGFCIRALWPPEHHCFVFTQAVVAACPKRLNNAACGMSAHLTQIARRGEHDSVTEWLR